MPSAQHVMLAIHCKRTENVELKNPILTYVRETYSDRDADDAVDDLAAIQGLRNEIVIAQTGTQGALKESLSKYFRALTAIETRFPISSDKGSVRVHFPWSDAFRPNKRISQANIHFEKASVLFNIAAVLSQQALQVERASGDGLKQACALFQESCGAYGLLKEAEANKVDTPRPVDLSPECLTMLEKLMLAQAQECVFHKATVDKKSPGVLARLAKQASLMYGEVCGIFSQPVLTTHFEKSWLGHTQLKASLYDVESLIQSGRQLNSETKVAMEIATLSEAFTRLQATKKLAKAVSSEMAESLRPMEESLSAALTKAQKDNAAVYLERVPAFADVPAVQPALLVKAAKPGGLDASGETYFSGLIPDNSAKALSKYTDMVDSLSRQLLDKLAGATDAARLALRQLELPDLLDTLDAKTHAAVPDALLKDVEEVQSIGGTSHLKEILMEIGDLRRNVDGDIAACQKALDEEASADAAARSNFGDKWNVPQSATLAKHLWEKLSSYRSTLVQAANSDQKVMQRLHDSEVAFSSLTPDMAAAQMPRLQAPLVSVSNDDPAVVVASLRRNMEALNQLSSERAGLEEALKEAKAKDNILPKLMASNAAFFDALFATELKKYDSLSADVTRNVARNDELLAAISRDVSTFRTVFDISAWRQACEAAAAGMRTNLKNYREVLDHLSEGLRFYMSLQEAIKAHQQQCSDFAYTRALQCDDLTADLERRAREERDAKAAQQLNYMSIQPSAPGPPAYPAPPQQTPHAAHAPMPHAPQAFAAYQAPPPGAPAYQAPQPGGTTPPMHQHQHNTSFSSQGSGQGPVAPSPYNLGPQYAAPPLQGGYAPQPQVQQPYHGGGGYGAPPAHQQQQQQQPYGGQHGAPPPQQQGQYQQQQPYGYQQQPQQPYGAHAPQHQQQQQQQQGGYGQPGTGYHGYQ